VVYDITKYFTKELIIKFFSRDSFENIKFWVDQAKENGNEHLTMMLVGNKNDLEDKRQVTYKEGT
jgi:GTPase SAR1 family protein